ncbi:MAG: hypothetical protein ABI811_19570 [Acidobacteriota bacterium]
MSDTRQHAHQLIDSLPETQLSGLVQFLETIVDPVARALRNAPLDDEPVTEEDRRRLHQGGHSAPMQDVLAEFGLTEADFPRR